jgi:hypothetical protein
MCGDAPGKFLSSEGSTNGPLVSLSIRKPEAYATLPGMLSPIRFPVRV